MKGRALPTSPSPEHGCMDECLIATWLQAPSEGYSTQAQPGPVYTHNGRIHLPGTDFLAGPTRGLVWPFTTV
jgi:hypothetical protein